ncbi:transporter substrate-binding domain-containing protein [Pandoraea sp. SD6-2]|uniref:transporter substrate-binding domain-containing protein n=1 Tax=Pandoraea sp. SD6-2 TaxID=1286093 RepID=UPI00032ED3E5|nr:transporter substrate-binding domain-containing protein [Pandoraea sp. SD6-2]EON12362.1 glutamine ABC transporter substrate binding protein GlnH [Pandoraea sp. SD6-2]
MQFKTRLLVAVLGACGFLSASSAASADQLSDVKARGTLTCGVLATFEPYGYTAPNREVVGYDVDMCNAVAKQLGVKAEVRPVAIEARIPELQQGRLDLLVAGLGYSPQRAEQVAFSDGYYVSEHKLVVRADKGYKSATDLNGKRVSFTKGGITEGFVRKTVPQATLVGFEDTPTAFMALVQGKVDAFSVSEVVSRRLISKLGANADKFKTVEPPVGQEVWGIGVRKTEPGMLKAVNDALHGLETSGEARQIFDKWLGNGSQYKLQRTFTIQPIKG